MGFPAPSFLEAIKKKNQKVIIAIRIRQIKKRYKFYEKNSIKFLVERILKD